MTSSPVIELTGSRRLCPEDIIFEGDVDVMHEDDGKSGENHFLNFYIACWHLDPDEVFGTNYCTDENDDYCNVYADYDMERGVVRDHLSVALWEGDECKTGEYKLSDEEKSFILPKMEEHCKKTTGRSLDEYAAEVMTEHLAENPSVFPIITKPAQRLFEKEFKDRLEGYLPELCGYYGRACYQMGKAEGANRMICTECVLAKFAQELRGNS